MAEAARRKVEWQYAKLETQKMVELKMKECEIEEMKKRKNYERAEAEAIALAKVEEEEVEKLAPDSLDDIPDVINTEDRVRQHLSSLPTDPIKLSAPITNLGDKPLASSGNVKSQVAFMTKPNQSAEQSARDDGSPYAQLSKLKPTATPLLQCTLRHQCQHSLHHFTQ